MDGVNILFAEAVWEYLRQIGKVTGPCPKVNNWYFYREPAWGSMTDKSFVETCHAGVDAGVIFKYGKPLEGSKEAVNAVYDAGHKVIIVTDRSFGSNDGKASRQATFWWLREHGYKFHEVVFTADKTTVTLDIMVDDKVENFVALRDHGVECYLLNQPWNQHVNAGKKRIYHINEYPRLVEKKVNERSLSRLA